MISINIFDHTKCTAWRQRIESVKHVFILSFQSLLTALLKQLHHVGIAFRWISYCIPYIFPSFVSFLCSVWSLYWSYLEHRSVAVLMEQHLVWRCVNFVMMWRATLQFLGATHCDLSVRCAMSVWDVLCCVDCYWRNTDGWIQEVSLSAGQSAEEKDLWLQTHSPPRKDCRRRKRRFYFSFKVRYTLHWGIVQLVCDVCDCLRETHSLDFNQKATDRRRTSILLHSTLTFPLLPVLQWCEPLRASCSPIYLCCQRLKSTLYWAFQLLLRQD